MKKFFLSGLLLTTTLSAKAYNAVDRFKILDDKIKTTQNLYPIGHDFFLDLNVAIYKDLPATINDISTVSKSNDVNKVLTTLANYNDTEETLFAHIGMGIPIFSFGIGEAKFQPNLRALVDAGLNVGISNAPLSNEELMALIPITIPTDLHDFILTLSAGDDVIDKCINFSSLSASTKAMCSLLPIGKYFIPNTGDPKIAVMSKVDAKVGFFNSYTYGEHFFGNFNLYGLIRADLYKTTSALSVARGEKIELPKGDQINTEGTAQVDYSLGYKNSNYRINTSVEEIKLAVVKKRKSTSKEHAYKYDPLIRLQADADYRLGTLSFKPYLGLHKRSGYSVGEGAYLGGIFGAHVFGDRLGISFNTMLEKDYVTLTPHLKLWLLELQYSLKNPLKRREGDVKLSAIHSIDLRLAF